MYEALEHYKVYKQEMDKFIKQLVKKNGETKY